MLAPPLLAEVSRLLLAHLQEHYALYGEWTGVRSARKHIAWYVKGLPGAEFFRQHMNTLDTAEGQTEALSDYLKNLARLGDRWPSPQDEMAQEALA